MNEAFPWKCGHRIAWPIPFVPHWDQ